MNPSSKDILYNISHLSRINYNPKTPFQAVTTVLLGNTKHPDDEQIVKLIQHINKQLALSEEEMQAYKLKPVSFMGKGSLIGIHNEDRETYRLVRAEHYKEYSLFCKNIERMGFNLYIMQNNHLDVVFV